MSWILHNLYTLGHFFSISCLSAPLGFGLLRRLGLQVPRLRHRQWYPDMMGFDQKKQQRSQVKKNIHVDIEKGTWLNTCDNSNIHNNLYLYIYVWIVSIHIFVHVRFFFGTNFKYLWSIIFLILMNMLWGPKYSISLIQLNGLNTTKLKTWLLASYHVTQYEYVWE